jgi:hypothetical protein
MEQYNSTSVTHTDRSNSIDRAEEAVSRNIERFEHAMQKLADRVEESRLRVDTAVDHVNKAREDVMRIKDSVVSTVEPFKPYAQKVGTFYSTARDNPRPYLLGVLGIIAGWLAYNYYQSRQETQIFDNTLEVHPTYQ